MDTQALAERYVAAWNEADPHRRREAVAALWLSDGAHYVNAREVHGHAELEQRIIGSHEKWVAEKGFRFRAVPNAQRLQDTVTFNWEMLAPDGEVRSTGLEFLRVDADDRIVADYQFIVMAPPQ